jgi:hypothetical protein
MEHAQRKCSVRHVDKARERRVHAALTIKKAFRRSSAIAASRKDRVKVDGTFA